MKRMRFLVALTVFPLLLSGLAFEVEAAGEDTPRRDKSLLLESRAGVRRALAYLKDQQQEDGSWRHDPAITGIVVTAMMGSGEKEFAADSTTVRRGLEFVRGFAKPNGGIYREGYANYTTSICVMALIEAGKPQDRKLIRKAKDYLLGLQADGEEGFESADDQYGGWGYEQHAREDRMHRADMSNTQLALEAVHALQQAVEEDVPEGGAGAEGQTRTELAFDNALVFLKKCQNEDGGFIYRPDESKAGKTPKGQLRSYAGMTYAGLKSMVYAQVDRDDPRVQAAWDWIRKHWDLTRNPGIGQQGLYYYYQTLAKALNAYGTETVTEPGGQAHDWRAELLNQLLKVQREDGSWKNENGRWMESIPELVTAYSVIAMETTMAGW